MPTPVESIEEFRVTTNNQTADFNSSAGAQVQMVTKRGTNQYHGSAYEYYFGNNFSANSWRNNHTPVKDTAGNTISQFTPLPATHYNKFGAAGGGPIAPSFLGGKTYLFANYEGFRYPNFTNFEKQVPSVLMRAGVIQVPDSTNTYRAYNLNPTP